MTDVAQRKAQFFKLADRYCELGRLLPALADIDTDNDAELAGIKVILAEMMKAKAQIDTLLAGTT
jgi:hypothetical protein